MTDFSAKNFYKRLTFLFLLALAFTANAFAQNDNASDRRPVNGVAAINKLGLRLPTVASRHGKSPEKLRRLFLEDPTLFVDDTDRLLYVDDFEESQNVVTSNEPVIQEAGPFPYTQTFTLHSRPGSNRVIYLDFNGHTTSGTQWNTSYTSGQPIVSAPFSIDSDPTTFSTQEQDVIQYAWQRIAEDYAPFDVDVTTQDPGDAAIYRSSTSDLQYGTRAVISPTNFIGSNVGGVAYVGVYDFIGTQYQPAFMIANPSTSAKSIAEATSHEVGHNLNLTHDGTATLGYYQGHGDWSPIMGVGYYTNISQWSRGEYPGANNQQDDLAIMQTKGLALIADDYGNTTASATVIGGSNINLRGLITTRADVDVFRFTTDSGNVSINISPAPLGGNLDIKAQILDSAGNVIATSDPSSLTLVSTFPAGISAGFNQFLPGGNYYLTVEGIGAGSLTDGYSDYASIGQYAITGTLINNACASSLNPTSINVPLTAGTGTVALTIPAGCSWTAVSNAPSWITITSNLSGTGSATVGYSVAANTEAQRTGTITIGGQTFTINQAGTDVCAPVAISFEQTVGGTLNTSSCTNTNGFAIKKYTFSGTANQQITIALSSSNFDTFLELYNGTTLVTSNDDSGGGLDSRIPANSGYFSLPATATYTIIVRGFSSGATGSYTLSLTQAPYSTPSYEGDVSPRPNGDSMIQSND
ncbi:MAG: BACON domain-containing protein, partial [Pyrinomonadaceae bacterium]